MKSNEIKYFWVSEGKKLVEIPLNKENWWFVQLNASIRYVFSTYDLRMPEAVLFNRAPEKWAWGLLTITIVRGNLEETEDILAWYTKRSDIKDYLNNDAMCNSTERMQYTFINCVANTRDFSRGRRAFSSFC